MPQLKIHIGSDQITFDTDQAIKTTDALLVNVLAALRNLREDISGAYDVDVKRIDPGGVFEYTLSANGPPATRVYRQTWFFDEPSTKVSFGEITGKWTVDELLNNIEIRNTLRDLHQLAGLEKFTCKW